MCVKKCLFYWKLKSENNKKIFSDYCSLLFSTVHLPICTVYGTWTVQEALSWKKEKEKKKKNTNVEDANANPNKHYMLY